jgi:type I restriction enzyme S subunit
LNSNDIKEFEIRLPNSITTQQKIASVLSSLDSKIELNNRINRELEQMAKLLYDYWFVQFEFPCPEPVDGPVSTSLATETPVPEPVEGRGYKTSGGKMVWNEELKREIPKGWKVKYLAHVTSSIMRGISPKYLDEGGICVLNQKCIRDQEIKFEFSRRHDHELKSANSKLIQYGDILVNSTGFGTLGRVAIVKRLQEQTTAVDSHITIVRGDSENIKKLFLGYSMLGRQTEIEGLAEGSTGQTELSRVNLGQLKMVIPPIELQSRFERFAEPLLQKMAVNEAENQQLASLRDWLLPMLMNGQVTVGAKEKVNYEVTEGMDVAAEPNDNK